MKSILIMSILSLSLAVSGCSMHGQPPHSAHCSCKKCHLDHGNKDHDNKLDKAKSKCGSPCPYSKKQCEKGCQGCFDGDCKK